MNKKSGIDWFFLMKSAVTKSLRLTIKSFRRALKFHSRFHYRNVRSEKLDAYKRKLNIQGPFDIFCYLFNMFYRLFSFASPSLTSIANNLDCSLRPCWKVVQHSSKISRKWTSKNCEYSSLLRRIFNMNKHLTGL